MAQSRLEKIGTIYSRLRGLQKSGAVSHDKRPLWFDVYEAFPPKYEPRWDRHLLKYGKGCDVASMGPPRKILYQEDEVRAKFYKVFYGEDVAKENLNTAERFPPLQEETFNLFESEKRDCVAQKFIHCHKELEKEGKVGKDELFKATVDTLELQGINLMNPQKPQHEDLDDIRDAVSNMSSSTNEGSFRVKRPSLKAIFEQQKKDES